MAYVATGVPSSSILNIRKCHANDALYNVSGMDFDSFRRIEYHNIYLMRKVVTLLLEMKPFFHRLRITRIWFCETLHNFALGM